VLYSSDGGLQSMFQLLGASKGSEVPAEELEGGSSHRKAGSRAATEQK
jgi:hypothetical protein